MMNFCSRYYGGGGGNRTRVRQNRDKWLLQAYMGFIILRFAVKPMKNCKPSLS